MKLRFPDFMTTAQDGGRLSALHTGRLYILYIRTSRFLPFQKDVHMTFVLFFSATICVFIVCLFFLSRVVAFFFLASLLEFQFHLLPKLCTLHCYLIDLFS